MLYEFLKERMLRHPNQVLSDGHSTVTYREALRFAERFAPSLMAPKYGILCDSELDIGFALLACFRAGATAIPLSMRYGQAHTDRIVRRIGLSHLITNEGGKLAVKQIAVPLPEREDLSGIALILCTSGTTGYPKGAMLTGSGLVANLLDIERYFAIGDTDTILIPRPLYHCAVLVGEFLYSLCRGLNIRFYNGAFSPVRLLLEIQNCKTNVFCGTPTLFYHLCRMAERQKEPLPLKAVAASGECMTPEVASTMRKVMPGTDIYNVYGLTEAGPRVSALPPEMFDAFPLSVGLPLHNVEVQTQNGELLVRGPSVMKGYYNDPTLTEQVLAGGWLHTGDAAKIDNAGRITVRGRMDTMVIRAGMNIYPQEIEGALEADPRITEVLAYGVQEGVTKKLCIKITAEGLDRAGVMAICRERLPAYEIPDVVEMVDALPRSASGKLLRPRLSA